MGFLESFNKKEDVKKENSSSNLDEMPPPPLPDKEGIEKKEEVKEKGKEKEKSEPIPPPPQFKKPAVPEPNLPKEPEKKEEPSQDAPKKAEPEKIEEPSAQAFAPNPSREEELPKEPIKPVATPESTLEQTPKTEKIPDQMSLPFGDITQSEPPKTQPQQSMMVPETLPEMPLFDSQTKTEESRYTFTQQSSITEEIPYFTNVKVEPQKDEFEELFNLPVIDVEEDTESYGRFKYRDLKKPLFIRTDHYSQILTNIDTMKTYVEESSDKISMLNNLKRNADIEHKKYKQVLEDVQRKLIYIDRVLFDS